jgi:aminopeptidase N
MTTGENLTRAEAADRSSMIAVENYRVELDVTPTGPTFRTKTTITFTCSEPGEATWVDLIAPEVTRIELNGIDIDHTFAYNGARITLATTSAHNTVVIEANGAFMNTGEGLHRFIDPVDNETYLYTQFESADARRMYACFEQPDLKATFQLSVTAPDHWKVVSNSPSPAPTPVRDGVAHWDFEPTPRMSTYITALVAGPYSEVRDEYVGPHGTYPLAIYCRNSLAEFLDANEIFTVTKQGFEFFERQFGVPYPFAKYDQLFVPEFNAGAMENAGCVTILEDYIFRSRVTNAAYEQRANTILHELAHMWFGDLVTMTWWDDLWLNESFAEWAAHHANVHATKYTDAWTTFANLRKAWAYRQDQLPSTHPIAADMVDLDSVRVNFDGITYAKGASALRQLVAWVGEEHFLAGLHNYFVKHAWKNTQLTDLLVELEATSGRDLGDWTREWLQTSGVNQLRPLVTVDEQGTYTSVQIEQLPPSAPAGIEQVLRSHRVGIGLFDLTSKGFTRRDGFEIDVVGALTDVPQLAGVNQPDLLLVNDGDLTFAKVRLDAKSWASVTEHIGDLDDPLARAVIWGAAWDMTRDAEVSTRDFLTLVLSGVQKESDVGVVQGVLRQLRAAIDQYAAPEHRDEYLITLSDATMKFALEAEAGSDHQLAFTRTFAAAATTPTQLDLVNSLFMGKTEWPGLAIDTDMRWFLLEQLVSAGRSEIDEIEAEVRRDDTATGHRYAAAARASRPSPEAKELAWADIFERTDLPNAIVEANIGGFVQPGQRELLAAFVDRYFAALPEVWEHRTMEIAQSVTSGLYPAYNVSDHTIAATDAFLAQDLNSALRRLVSEGRDGVLRAMRAQQRDREAG